MARKLLAEDGGGKLHTFSAIFPDVPSMDERRFIDAVLATGGVVPHSVRADLVSPLADVERVLDCQDEPFYAPNLYMHWALYGRARGAGVRVLFDGLDGDTTVSHGVARLDELAIAGRWLAFWQNAWRLGWNFERPVWRLLWNHGLRPRIPDVARRVWRRLRHRGRPWWQRDWILSDELSRRLGVPERIERLVGGRRKLPLTVHHDHLWQLESGLIPFVLELCDRLGSAFRMETRFPFFDRRLVEFCLGLPSQQRLDQGWTRVVQRRAMAPVLPPAVCWRPGKTNLFPHFRKSFLTLERSVMERVLVREPDILADYVDGPALQRTLARYAAHGGEGDAMSVWRAVTLALWLRRFAATPPSLKEETFTMEAHEKAPLSTEPPDKLTPAKARYTTPHLTVHGPVEELTRNVGTKGSDAITGSVVV
ncbi:MAG: hypothetical protein AUI36_06480 [Cyanobacteria bacterium 13_1_40CM_2_61_4]|nr:MAG: hypothetical protein AUI36_06480 [Cyanobacteria bacterium 13_1_40CM_2_61_4]